MPLVKNPVNINFSQGLDLKSDSKQVAIGKFLTLENSVFTKAGLLQKRNGFPQLAILPNSDSTFLTTFNGNLTAIGKELFAYSAGSNSWSNKGSLQPVKLDTLSVIRSSYSQTQQDSVVAANGLSCVVYTETTSTTTVYKYAIYDSNTGQNVVLPTILPGYGTTTQATPKVFYLGKFFVIVFGSNVSSNRIRYFAINSTSPTDVVGPVDLTTQYSPSSTGSFDGIVANGSLYIAWNGSDIGGAVRMTYIDSTLLQHNTVFFTTKIGTIFSLTADISTPTPIIYTSFFNSATSLGYTLAVDASLNTVLAPVSIIPSGSFSNIASVATGGVCRLFLENVNAYGYDGALKTNYISTLTVTQAGTASSTSILKRSVGLASKAFIYDGIAYFLSVYDSAYQPTYFLLDQSGNIVSKLAYSNAGGYYTTGLPNISIDSSTVKISYLIKDLLQVVNKAQGAVISSGIYSQTGINLASFTFTTEATTSAEIGQALHLSGGFLWMYDGFSIVENGFFLWPDNLENSASGALSITGDTTNLSDQILNASSTTGLVVGMEITGTGIPASTTITNISGTTLTISQAATATNTGTALTITGSMSSQVYYYQAVYEWTDNQGNIHRSSPSVPLKVTTPGAAKYTAINIPTLRMTYKVGSPIRIVLYRWSAAQETYYQITSVSDPLLNDTSVDYVTYTDIATDAAILGNNIIYTTGGVVENVAAPALDTVALYQSRLFGVDSEDKNLIWFSKQVIEATPVEMSDLLTMYIAPTTSAQGNTGPVRAISVLDDKLVLFKKNAMYYVSGVGPDNTGANNGFSEPTFITATVGSENPHSIVFMPQGLMFQSDKGIWLLGRDLSTKYIGAPVEDYNSNKVVSALNIPETNQVRFTLDNGVTLMYDYFYNQWGTFTSVPAISSTLYNSLHTYIDAYGKVFQELPGSYLDGGKPVLMKVKTGWISLAGLQGFERFYEMLLLGEYLTPFKLSSEISYDYNPGASQNTIISPDNYSAPWGGTPLWGSGSIWGGNPSAFKVRVFPVQQKCETFQVTLTEIYDPSIGVAAGAGLTLSGMTLIVGAKRAFRTSKSSQSFG